jgi:hypothetical protein
MSLIKTLQLCQKLGGYMKIPKNLSKTCEKIRRECFWVFTFTESEIYIMARRGTDREKLFLFSKLIENSSDLLKALAIFSPGDQQKLINTYKVPSFNSFFLEKRHKILRYFINNENVDIPQLRWNIYNTKNSIPYRMRFYPFERQ